MSLGELGVSNGAGLGFPVVADARSLDRFSVEGGRKFGHIGSILVRIS